MLHRLAQALRTVRHGTHLTRQADLAEYHGTFGERPVAEARYHRQGHREIGAGLVDAHTAHDVDEDVLIVAHHPRMAMQDRQQHGQSIRIEPYCDSSRVCQMGLVQERLHLDEQGPGALARHHDGAAGHALGVALQKDRRGIGHLAQPGLGHGEDPELVHRPVAVLDGAHDPIAAALVALEIEHRVHHVLEHPRPGQHTLLGHMPYQEHCGTGALGVAHELRGGLAELAHRAGGAGQRLAVEGLDRVDHEHPRRLDLGRLQDPLDPGLGQKPQVLVDAAEAMGPERHLLGRLFAAHVETPRLAPGRQRLQEERRLPYPRVAPE